MVGGEAAVLSARRDSGGVQRCCLSARVNREACPIGGGEVQLIEGIDGDKTVAVGDSMVTSISSAEAVFESTSAVMS